MKSKMITAVVFALCVTLFSACGPGDMTGSREDDFATDTQIKENTTFSTEAEESDKNGEEDAESRYAQYIQDIRDQSSGTEGGKIRCDLPSAPGRTGFCKLYEQYAVADVDSDGTEELLLWYENRTENVLSVLEVLRYESDLDDIKQVAVMYSTMDFREVPVFYANGIVRMNRSNSVNPVFFFIKKDATDTYDFSGRDSLKGSYCLSFLMEGEEAEEKISGAFDVDSIRNIPLQEAETIILQLESDEQVPMQIKHF